MQEGDLSGKSVREFVQVLKLHHDYPAALIAQAVEQALEYGCIHADGVKLCVHQLLSPSATAQSLNPVGLPQWASIGEQPPDLSCYDRLLARV